MNGDLIWILNLPKEEVSVVYLVESPKRKIQTMISMGSWTVWKLKEVLKVLNHLSHQNQPFRRKGLKLPTLDSPGEHQLNWMI